MIQDMPKIESPFYREMVKVQKGRYDLPSVYICVPKINPDYEWVFTDPNVKAIEKLHGTNVSIVVAEGSITSIWNRTARIPFFNKGKKFITEALLNSHDRGYCELEDGQWFGEVIGPRVNGNPYHLEEHLWIPFKTYGWEKLAYKSWESGKYPKTYEAIREWFKTLMPLFTLRVHGKEATDKHFVEGVVFTHPDGRMAKLRVDMFDFYTGRRHNKEEEQ